MIVFFQQSEEAIMKGITPPCKAHSTDSGFDIFSPIMFTLTPGERLTIDLDVRFQLPENSSDVLMWEAQIRPKSGRSMNGLDVELGTIDNGYRGFTKATVTNVTNKILLVKQNEKLCQIVFAPVFKEVLLVAKNIDSDTDRGETGFGDSGLVKK